VQLTVDRAQARDHDKSVPEYRTAEIFVGGIPHGAPEHELRRHFERFGPVCRALALGEGLTGLFVAEACWRGGGGRVVGMAVVEVKGLASAQILRL
jgi:RNA recognition motif-containing protein